MCGIAGLIGSLRSQQQQHRIVNEMLLGMRNRGPDGNRIMSWGDATLGIARLSIHDCEHGWQPFFSADKTIVSCTNGEIYNFRTLKEQISQSQGYKFLTGSDCEVVPHLFHLFGAKAFKELSGMYGVCIYDSRRRVATLARDYAGEKPLYYIDSTEGLMFASDPRVLLRAAGMPLTVDDVAFTDYLRLNFSAGANSYISGVRRVEAGTRVEYDVANRECNVFRNFAEASSSPALSDVEEIISAAVTEQLTADVPVGLAMSAGLDSCLVAKKAVEAQRHDIVAFTLGYDGTPSYDERAIAVKFSKELDIPHHEIVLQPDAVIDDFGNYVKGLNEPVADFSGYSYYSIARAASELGVKVLLFGQGMDEAAFGYEWMRKTAAWNRYRRGEVGVTTFLQEYICSIASSVGGGTSIKDLIRMSKGTITDIMAWSQSGRARSGYATYEATAPYLDFRSLSKELSEMSSWLDSYAELSKHKGLSALESVRQSLLQGYLVENGLSQIDSLTMAHSVEARNPLVDKRVLRTVGAYMQEEARFTVGKKTFMKLYEKNLPSYICNRKKTGFNVPVDQWVSGVIQRWESRDLYDQVKCALPRSSPTRDVVDKIYTSGTLRQRYKIILFAKWLESFAL